MLQCRGYHRVGCARLPEVRARQRGGARKVAAAVPVADEVHPAAISVMHPKHEIEKPVGPGPQPLIASGGPEIAQQHKGTSGIVHTGHSFIAGLSGCNGLTLRVRVNGDRKGIRPGSRHWAGQLCQLVQQGARDARISFTSKSAAAMQLSAAP